MFEAKIRKLKGKEIIHHKDHIQTNNHPINLKTFNNNSIHTSFHSYNSKPKRIPLFEVYMRMAEIMSKRSHHGSTRVGCIIVSNDLRRVLGSGFNGNCRGLINDVDSSIPGQSGTIHAEENALLIAGEHTTERVMFITHSPCLMCVKKAANAGIKYIYYRKPYRDLTPLGIARYLDIQVCHYNKWATTEW
jgi:dCMP deaminase